MRISVLDVRNKLADTLNRVAYQGERAVLTRHGKGVAALVSIDDLQLLEEMEDRADIAAAEAALREGGEPIPWEQVKKELGLKGLGKRANGRKSTRARSKA